MSLRKSRFTIVLLTVGIVTAAIVGLLVLKSPSDESTKTGGSSSTSNVVTTDDFTYKKPQAWAKLSKEFVGESGAASGIALPGAGADSLPLATFMVKVSDATPRDDADLKNSSLKDIEKNAPNFKALSTVATSVDGQAGYKFTYAFGETDDNKTRQQLSVVAYKGKTYFFLSSSTDKDFESHTTDFDAIIASIKFN